MWPYTLSGRLPVIGLVGLYPTNYLMGRSQLLERLLTLYPLGTIEYYPRSPVAIPVSRVPNYVLLTRSPLTMPCDIARSTCMLKARRQRSF